MYFIFTQHAEENVKERKISKDLIKNAILNPDKIFNSIKNRKIAHKIIKNKLLRVIYKETGKAYIVITFYYTMIERYENES